VEIDETIETKAAERRNLERDPLVDVAYGVAPLIAVGGRVRQLADPDAVHDDDDGAAEGRLG
jgi:hypothetical protein